ncbi:hypothetical protein EPD60_16605 [Flaviaesturariibacter flavus]|uniref:Uncharacterized protein n=1 Tax=Flaviaesturariibacter flavus TaxID=2502780 RepID=A0A4V2NV50_9BACT|nr:hypothetical protein [Flaviaesturariibacter flavus]TCJ12166.1 hypothetical protein EPD60_16605 [Flaviaesturariibacter flavus]
MLRSWQHILRDHYQKDGGEKNAEQEKPVKEVELLHKRLDDYRNIKAKPEPKLKRLTRPKSEQEEKGSDIS